jgi:ABC-type transport system substrate-binding protein
MNDKQRNIGHFALYAGVIGAMAVSLVPATAHNAAAQGNSRKIGDFTVSGRFLQVWSAQGNDQADTYVNGLPLTDVHSEISTDTGKAYDTQWFERAKYEAHPENQAPYDVLLGRLGANQVQGRGRIEPSTGKVTDPADAAFVKVDKPGNLSSTLLWFPETGHTVSGKILQYWNQYGGLQQFGYPLSEPFNEISATDGKTYQVQYFERNRFEVHPELQDPYAVLLGLLGVQQYKTVPIAADKLPIAPIAGNTTTRTTMNIGSQQEPTDLTPFDNAAVSLRVQNLVTKGLTNRDYQSNVYPEAAWYVPTLENGGAYYVGTGDDKHLVVKYKLRQGVKWSDGNELTSQDPVFYYALVMNPNTPVTSRSEFQKVQFVDNPDKYTDIFNYRSYNQLNQYYNSIPDKQDYGFLKVYLDAHQGTGSLTYSEIGGTVLPSKALANVAPADIRTVPFASTAYVGLGPYKVASWNKGQEMDLTLDSNYNLTGAPLIKDIKIKFVEDGNQLISQAKTGALDYIFEEAFNAPPADTAGLKAAGYSVVQVPATTWEHLDFYFNYGPFTDLKVRQAIMMGINRKRVSDVVYFGGSAVMNSVVPPLAFHSLDNPDFAKNFPDLAAKYKLPNNDYNPDAAKKLLDDAGWVVNPSTGIREKGGEKLSFEYGTTTKVTRQQTAPLVSADLKAIGVDAVPKFYTAGVFFAGDNTDPRATGITKLAEFAYIGSVDSDFSSWTCDQKWDAATNAGANEQQYCNHDLDTANGLFQLGGTRHDIAAASAQAQSIIANDVVVVPMVALANITVLSDKVQNFKETNSQYPSTYEAAQWSFK